MREALEGLSLDKLVFEPLDRHLNFKQAWERLLARPLPAKIGWRHYLGIVPFHLLGIQVISGVLLAIYYKPSPEEAYPSVQFIINHAPLGWLVRQVHAWSANLLILFVFLHMIRVFFAGAYRAPRELNWAVGVCLFFVVLGFGFTGYLLPWDQLAYWSTSVGTDVMGWLPIIGHGLMTLFRGGEDVTGETLTRFYVFHTIILPWVIAFLLWFHFVILRRQGLAAWVNSNPGEVRSVQMMETIPPPAEAQARRVKYFYPDFVFDQAILLYVLFGVLLTLSIVMPIGLEEKADPLTAPEVLKPEWYFLAVFQFIKYLPKSVGTTFIFFGLIVLFILPTLERRFVPPPRRRMMARTVGVVIFLLYLALTTLGWLSETTWTILGKTYRFDYHGVPHRVAEQAKTVEPVW